MSDPLSCYFAAKRLIATIGLLAITQLTLTAPVMAQAGSGANTAIPARVLLIEPLSLTKIADLDFGWVAPPVAGTVTMTYDDEDGSICAASPGLLRGGTCTAAEFVGLSFTGERVRIRLPARREVTLTGPGRDMTVMDVSIYTGAGLSRRNNGNGRNQQFDVISASGLFFFHVGGTLNVNANQTPGLYDGTFEIQLDYR